MLAPEELAGCRQCLISYFPTTLINFKQGLFSRAALFQVHESALHMCDENTEFCLFGNQPGIALSYPLS